MARKTSKGQINFFRFMAVIGVAAIIWIVGEFLSAAPALPISKAHHGPPPPQACLECHVQKSENTPIMPHRPMDDCVFCHKPANPK
ncbi:hypothetical protein UZ36_03900 [Candidatus Nitromaritima sp. SCGC AAA799-C22]|nr:hypothetical protein UZ36_03900 [Candidatus Nitromaritima sp. SCGC AAA799-C22]